MRAWVHVIDADTPPDRLDHLRAIVDETDEVVTIGPSPVEADGLAVRPVRLPISLAGMHVGADELMPLADRAEGVVFWSLSAARRTPPGSLAGRPRGLALAGRPRRRRAMDALRNVLAGDRRLRVLVPTGADRDQLAALGVDRRRLAVLPPAAPVLEDQASRRSATRRRLELGETDILLLAGQDVTDRRAHRNAIWVHSILRAMDVPAWLVLPRIRRHHQEIRRLIHDLGHEETTLIPRDPLPPADALSASDVVLALDPAPCTAELASALGAGRAVVAFDQPANRELLGAADEGQLVEPGAIRQAARAVLHLAEDADLRARAAEGARRRGRDLAADRAREALRPAVGGEGSCGRDVAAASADLL
jgi:glycosyltransferase involved in cell wall biosynthesis